MTRRDFLTLALKASIMAPVAAVALAEQPVEPGASVAAATREMATAALADPPFEMPFPQGQTWKVHTYKGHPPSYYSIDLNWGSGNADLGKPVLAGISGIARTYPNSTGGYGNYVVVDVGGGWKVLYAHLDRITVGNGQQVDALTQIGTVGKTGNVTAAHLHYEQRLNNVPQRVKFHGTAVPLVNYPNYVNVTSQNGGGGGGDVLQVDDESGDRFWRTGAYWWRFGGHGSGGAAWYTYANGMLVDCTATWRFSVGSAGSFRAEPFVTAINATAHHVHYKVKVNGQTVGDFYIDQARYFNQYVGGLTFQAPAGATIEVTVLDDGGDSYPLKIGVDSCRLIRV